MSNACGRERGVQTNARQRRREAKAMAGSELMRMVTGGERGGDRRCNVVEDLWF